MMNALASGLDISSTLSVAVSLTRPRVVLIAHVYVRWLIARAWIFIFLTYGGIYVSQQFKLQ